MHQRAESHAEAGVATAAALEEHDASSPTLLSFDEALAACGTGRAQRSLLLLCGLGNAADAVELLAVSLVLPAVGPDGRGALRLTLPQLALLSSSLFWGALVGTLAWGFLSDSVGRKRSLALSMAVAGTFGLLSAFATSFAALLLLRTLAGVGVGGSVPVVFAYLSEFLPTATRGRYMCLLASFWMVGSIATALAGLALVPRHPVHGWRVFLACASLPSLACALWSWRSAPESPRFLLVQRRGTEAMAVLRSVAAQNGRLHALPQHAQLIMAPLPKAGAAQAAPAQAQLRALRSLFAPPLRRTTVAVMFVWCAISFGWYGTVLWFPEYFAAREEAASPAPAPQPGAGAQPLSSTPFTSQLAVAASNLPGNLLSVWLIDRVGRRATLAASLAGGAAAALLFAFAPGGRGGLALGAACAFNGVSVGAWNALDTYSAEVLPTAVRTTGLGIFSAAGRLGSIWAQLVNGALLPLSQWAPLVPGAGVMLAAAFCVMVQLPTETAGRALRDDVAQEGQPAEGEADAEELGAVGGAEAERARLLTGRSEGDS